MQTRSTASWGTEKGFVKLCEVIGLKLEPFQGGLIREVFAGRRELLVLMPRGNGKTTLFAALALYHLIVVPQAKIFIGAAATEQAKLAYDVIRDFIQGHPKLSAGLTYLPGYKEIRNPKTGGVVKVLSSDAPKALGLQPTLVLIDELCAHENDDLYVALKTALGKNPMAQLMTISTAGYDQTKILYRMREGFRQMADQEREGRLLTVTNPEANSMMFEWSLEESDDLLDPAVLKEANPATFVTQGFLAEQVNSPGLPAWDIARYHANVWTPTYASWLPAGAWDACQEDGAHIPDGVSVYLGVDVGLRRDTSSVVALWQREDGRWVVDAEVWKPPGGDDSLDLFVVENAIRERAARWDVLEVVFDPWRFQRSADMLEEEGLLMVQFDGNNARTVPASGRLYEAINRQELVHDGDPVLAAHVRAGVKQDTERGWRLVKAKAKMPMDALYAMMLAFSRAEVQVQTPFVEVF